MSTHPLLFVRELAEKAGPRDARITYWAPPCAGLDYTAACVLGEELALEAVQYMRAENLAPLLGWSVMEMTGLPGRGRRREGRHGRLPLGLRAPRDGRGDAGAARAARARDGRVPGVLAPSHGRGTGEASPHAETAARRLTLPDAVPAAIRGRHLLNVRNSGRPSWAAFSFPARVGSARSRAAALANEGWLLLRTVAVLGILKAA